MTEPGTDVPAEPAGEEELLRVALPGGVVPEFPAAPVAEPVGGKSPAEQLRERFAEAVKGVQVPAAYVYEIPDVPDLLARFRTPDPDVVKASLEGVNSTRSGWESEWKAGLLADHCEAVLFRSNPYSDEGLVSADLAHPDEPAPTFDKRLADALGLPFVAAPQLVIAVYRSRGWVVSAWDRLWGDAGYGQSNALYRSRPNV